MRKFGSLACLVPLAAALFTPSVRAETADPHWPHVYNGPQGSVTVYEPQVISWQEHATLDARAAVSVARNGAAPILGTVEITLKTQTDPGTRGVILTDPKLIASHFPTLDTAQAAQLEARLSEALPRMETKSVPLDMVLLGLKETSAAGEAPLNNRSAGHSAQ